MDMGLYAKTKRSLSIGSAEKSTSGPSYWGRLSGSTFSTFASLNENTNDDTKLKKVVQLRNSKHGGTTIKNNSGYYEYLYNPLEVGTNPYHTKSAHQNEGFFVELSLDALSKNVYLSDLATQADNPATPSRSSPIYADSSTTIIPNASESSYNNAGVTISGKLKICVNQTKKPVYIKSHCIKLKCFVHEYVCIVESAKKDGSATKRIVKMVEDGDEFCHMLPYKEIKVDIDTGDEICCLTSGTHEFPFSFHLKDFPASESSYFGKTFYRLESVTQVVKNVNKRPWIYDTIILTDEVTVKRILSTANSNLKHESILLQGSWRGTELNYNVILNTKLIEIGVPFGIQLGLMKDMKSNKMLEKVTISLSQTITIPCLDSKTSELLQSSYSKRNEIELYEIDLQEDHNKTKNDDNFHFYEIGNLKVPPTDKSQLCKNWLKPYYCELSTKYSNRARLKITHTVILRLLLSNITEPKSPQEVKGEKKPKNTTCLTLKIPILLVDQDMSNNLWLPPYKRFTTVEQFFEDEPPSYYHDDSIEPPNYLAERSN